MEQTKKPRLTAPERAVRAGVLEAAASGPARIGVVAVFSVLSGRASSV